MSCSGLAPVVALAQRCGLAKLVADKLSLPSKGGANGHLKVPALVAGMVAGADCIDDMDLLRHGGMDRVVRRGAGALDDGDVPADVHLRSRPPARQCAASLLGERAAGTPLLAGADQVAFVDVDDTIRATQGNAKQGAGYGYSGVKGLNALLATVSTPLSRPVIAATRLRASNTNSGRGASRLVADALADRQGLRRRRPARQGPGRASGRQCVLRPRRDCRRRRAGARFSITARMNPTVSTAISSITNDAWTAISSPTPSRTTTNSD